MKGTLDYLSHRERAALDDCAARLHQAVGDKLMGLWLFGSKARGDFDPDSDIDLLVIIKTKDWDVWHAIRQIAARCSLEYDVLFNTHILDRARWEKEVRYQGTLWREIQRDGASLMPATVS